MILWMAFYEIPSMHKRLSKNEFDFIHSDKDEPTVAVKDNEKKYPGANCLAIPIHGPLYWWKWYWYIKLKAEDT